MKTSSLTYLFPTLLLALSPLQADDVVKAAIKSNGQVIYTQKPANVDTISELFTEATMYGRIRSNNFYYAFDNQDTSHDTHAISGLGASFIYQSASYNDFDFRIGAYGSYAFYDDVADPTKDLKAGHDLVSRYDYLNHGDKYMAVIGQAYLRYGKTDTAQVILGRQLVETFYTKSNDTKIIPNTFDGLVLNSDIVDDTSIRLAYLYEQKLRDHTSSHAVLMYGDDNSSSTSVSGTSKYTENDDSAMHKGLTYTALKAADKPTDAPLITGDVHNTSVKNLKADASFYVVPELVSQIMLEANYKMDFDGFSVSPGARYIKQFDNGAGAVGGAALSGTASATTPSGYKDPTSLEAQMIAARVVTKVKEYKINLGYTNILDEADLVTPWRGFPTAGYTRSMARYNWTANTQSYRLELTMNDNKAGIYKDVFVQTSVLYTNADEDKSGKDEMYYYIGFIQNIPSILELQWRLRLGYAQYINSDDAEFNNLDTRFELNYTF